MLQHQHCGFVLLWPRDREVLCSARPCAQQQSSVPAGALGASWKAGRQARVSGVAVCSGEALSVCSRYFLPRLWELYGFSSVSDTF